MQKEKIKLGYIGLGRRGSFILDRCFAEMTDVEIVAICDLKEDRLKKSCADIEKKGRPAPLLFTDYHEMLKIKEMDAVVIMTAWNSRIQCAIDCMDAGKQTAIEVGCAYSMEECQALLDAYHRTGIHAMMLENCCYGRREMMALRMAREGLLGEIVFCTGAYHHYLNKVELFKEDENGKVDTEHYRLAEYAYRNCEQYPTHALGPIAKLLNINRGNRMVSLSAFSTKACGLKQYMKDHVPADHPFYNADFRQGDIVTTVITCAGGEQIRLTLDTTLPRAFYSREFSVRGTLGMCEESGKNHCTFYLEGMEECFDNETDFYEKYDHPLRAEYATMENKGGHGGLDWLVMRAFVESVKDGVTPPIDIYDTLTWLAIGPLSEASLARGGAPVEFPDFTNGKWFRRESPNEGKYSLDVITNLPEIPIIPE